MPLARSIADALGRGAAIVAASPRAARALQLRFAEDRRAAGETVWPTPSIYDWDTWLRDLWREHAFATPGAPVFLTLLQERALWKRAQRDDGSLVLSPDSMAALAAEAWSLLSAYEAHAARRQSWEQTDAERFRHWAAEFDRECTRHGWLSARQLEPTLAALLSSGAPLALSSELVLVGFDRTAPAQRNLLAALESRGVAITDFRPAPSFTPEQARRRWVAADDLRDEIATCAAWGRDLLFENPGARIGVIVPAIHAARGEMNRAFRNILMPASEDIRQPSSVLPWEFSLGQPLADVPAIRAALLLMRWIGEPLREEEITWLMLSGFVADTVTNHLALAWHDARQRRYGILSPERSLATFRDSLKSPGLGALNFHLGNLSRAAASNRVLDNSRLASAWSDLVPRLLEHAGWPGQRSADSLQFQAIQRWQRLLDDVALLDFDGSRLSWSDFINLLSRAAQEAIFAPESHDTPIQIMGPFESSGQQFDALWFMSTDDATWPRHGRLHPLLPPTVQRQFAMPHATTDDDWNLAHAVTTRLLVSAPRIVFSYAQRDKDAELRPSPLIAGLFPFGTRPESASSLRPGPAASRPEFPERIPDESVLPWPVEQNAGGADVLRRQASCPFQAFAAKRLRAEELDETEWGLTPLEKGKLLHAVMQRLFSGPDPVPLRSRDDIVTAIDTKQIHAIVEAHIDAELTALLRSALADPWQQACLAAEKRRLTTQIEGWLRIEATRQPFTVEACEHTLPDVHIGELRLKLRADRIDLLPDGSRFLLDYKTGPVTPAAWEGARPEEPQLPLYAAYGNVENVSGVLFAQIRAGQSSFKGRVRDAQTLLDSNLGPTSELVKEPYSDSLRDAWARALENLAREFLEGEAAVDPMPRACGKCSFQSLCRIAELNLVTASADEDEEDADD